MPTAYKLTDHDGKTHGGTQWATGVTHTAPGTGALCTSGWIHVYDHPLVGLLLNPIHGGFPEDLRLWEVEWSGTTQDDRGLKRGVQSCTILRELPVPHVTPIQRVRFAILCADHVLGGGEIPNWRAWARAWLGGTDRTAEAAGAARAAEAAVWSARAACSARAAEAAAGAAEAAACSAWSAEAEAWAARAAVSAAYSAGILLADMAQFACSRKKITLRP